MGQIEFSMWANENALSSNFVVFVGGLIAIGGGFTRWEIGIYAVIAAILSFVVEYPRGKKQRGSSHERKFQYPLTVLVSHGKLLTRNYFVRFVFYLMLSVPCFFVLSTVLGALCYVVTGIIYLVAGIKGEEWTPIPREKESQEPKIIPDPKRPPPRLTGREPQAAAETRNPPPREPDHIDISVDG